jgi:hypothetical protein
MFGLFQNTPPYAGDGQPTSNSSQGAFGFLNGLFGFPATPKYATAEREPSSMTGAGAILAAVPTTDPQACEQVMAQPACSVPLPVAILIQRSE